MKTNNRAKSGWITLLIVLVCTFSARAQFANPRFDWFEYRGQDSIYNQLETGSDEYLNPIISGFHPDPSLVRVGEDYYLVNSSFSFYPGIPIFHSKDLVNWEQIGHVLDRPSQLPLDSLAISWGVFAPTIRYHEGTYYVINTLVNAGGNFLVTADDPAGPWSDPVWLPFDGIDPSIFFDDNGKTYIVNNGVPPGGPTYQGHRAIWLQEFDLKTQKMVGPRTVIVNGGTDISKKPIWIEGPHIFKVDGTYYLIAAEGGTSDNHSEVVFKSDSIRGPYTSYADNPILTQRTLDSGRANPVTSSGHADFVQTQNGDWWAVFLACRPYRDGYYNTGRETFMMPVQWKNGWPVIPGGTDPLPFEHPRPDLPTQKLSGRPTSGNFTIRDDFDEEELPMYWNFIRTPRSEWYDLDSEPGWLTIEPREDSISSLGQPSFVGRRQQHLHATASTAMKYDPQHPGYKAGMAAFQNRDYYFFLGVAWQDGKPVVRVEKRAGDETGNKTEVIASAPLEANRDGKIYLKIEARGADYNFYYAEQKNDWKLLKDKADGTILSTQKAGGFVGAYFGLYSVKDDQ